MNALCSGSSRIQLIALIARSPTWRGELAVNHPPDVMGATKLGDPEGGKGWGNVMKRRNFSVSVFPAGRQIRLARPKMASDKKLQEDGQLGVEWLKLGAQNRNSGSKTIFERVLLTRQTFQMQ
jgi:hypothetical protein